MANTKTVKSCKNCTISEVWVQITGMPNTRNLAQPYPLFEHLKQFLEKENYKLQCGLRREHHPVLLNIQTQRHNMEICPPFWNGEIKWTENNHKKILRTGHQFLALHSLFNEKVPYINYASSFECTLKKIIQSISDNQAFETIELRMRYINTIKLKTQPNDSFNVRDYFKVGFFHDLGYPLSIRNSSFNYEYNTPEGIILGVNTSIRVTSLPDNLLAVVETTGVKELKEKIKLNTIDIINQLKLIKEKLKEIFFDIMTDKTKDDVMKVQYG